MHNVPEDVSVRTRAEFLRMSKICTRLSQSDNSEEKKALVFQIIAEISADETGAVVLSESLFQIRKISDEVGIVNRVINCSTQ